MKPTLYTREDWTAFGCTWSRQIYVTDRVSGASIALAGATGILMVRAEANLGPSLLTLSGGSVVVVDQGSDPLGSSVTWTANAAAMLAALPVGRYQYGLNLTMPDGITVYPLILGSLNVTPNPVHTP